MQPWPEMMPMMPQMAGCCAMLGVMPFLVGIVTPVLAVGSLIYLLTKQPEPLGDYEG